MGSTPISYANVAQLVVQLIRNQQVAGPSPAIGSKGLPQGSPFCVFVYFEENAEQGANKSNWINKMARLMPAVFCVVACDEGLDGWHRYPRSKRAWFI